MATKGPEATDPAALPVSGAALHQAAARLAVTHVVTVPDTHQRSFLDLLFEDPGIEVVTVSTEHEAIGVNAGLYLGGANPAVVIQQLGLFASVNAMRGIAIDMRIPTFVCAGLYGRDVSRPVPENSASSVRLIRPLLDSLAVPHRTMEGPDDLWMFEHTYNESREQSGPSVVLIGAPTT